MGTSSNFLLSASNLIANASAASQNIYISDTNSGTTTINGASGANGTFALTTAGSLVLGANVSGAVDTITASGSGTITQTAGTVTGSTSAAFTSGSGAIGTSGTNISINTPSVTANTTGNVYLTDSSAATIGAASTGAIFSLTDTAGGASSINVSHTITASGALSLLATGTNGGIVLGANVSGTVDTITASGSGTITQTAGTVTGSTSAAFTSGSGAIGSLNIATPNWTANTTGAVTLVDTTATTGNGISTGSNISFTDSANSATALTTSGTITASGTLALLATGTNGGIVLGGNVSGTVDTITATGSGTITQTAGTVTGTTSAAFTSTSGAIGTSGANISINTPTVTANTTGNVYLTDSAAVATGGTSTGAIFSLTDTASNATAITVAASDTITASGALSLLATGTNGGIVLGANASGTVDTITATGSGTITQTGGTVTGSTSAAFTSGSGAIGTSGTNISINTPSVTANTTGNVYLTDSSAVAIGGASTGAIFSLTDTAGTTGNITVSNGITASGALTLQGGTNGGIAVNANLSGSSVTLNAAGTGAITQTAATNISTAGTLTLYSGSGTIGTSGANILTNAPTLIANTSGNVYVNDSNSSSVTIGGASTGNTFAVTANGALTQGSTSDTITASNTYLTSTNGSIYGSGGATSNFLLSSPYLTANASASGQNVYLSNTAGVTLINNPSSAGGTFALTSAGIIYQNITSDTITATNVNLTSTGGSIYGSSGPTSNFVLSANNLTANANASQNVYISDTNSGTTTINGASGAGGTFALTTAGSLTQGSTSDTITASNTYLTSTNGSIYGSGGATSNFLLSSPYLTANASASGQNVYLSNTAGVTLINNPSSAGGTFALTSAGIIYQNITSDTITATNVNLTSTSGSIYGSGGTTSNFLLSANNLTANANAAGQNVHLSDAASGGTTINGASGAGGTFALTSAQYITQGNTSDTITANSINLTATNGSIYGSGGATSNFLLSANNLTANANAAGQNVYLSDAASGSTTLNGASGAGATFALTTAGSLVLGANVSAAVDIITASGAGTITQTAGTVTGTTSAAFTSTSGAIGTSGTNISINTPSVSANTTGNVYLTDSSAVAIGGASTGAIFSLTDTAGGAASINVSHAIAATGALSLLATGTNGGIVLGNNVSGTVDTITASGAGTITQTGGTLTGSTSAALSSGSGNIGSINTSTPSLTLNTTGTATVVNSGAGALSLASGGDTFAGISVNTDNSLTTTNNITATGGTIGLVATGAISLGGNLNAGSAGTINLTSNSTIGNSSAETLTAGTMAFSQGSGGVAVTGNNIVEMGGSSANLTLSGLGTALSLSTAGNITTSSTNTLTAPSVTLASTAGSIGTSGNAILTAASTLTANASGNVYVSDANAVTIGGASSGSIFSLTDTAGGAGSITVSHAITATGALSLLATGTNGGIVLGANVSGTTDTITASGSGTISQTAGTATGSTSAAFTSERQWGYWFFKYCHT